MDFKDPSMTEAWCNAHIPFKSLLLHGLTGGKCYNKHLSFILEQIHNFSVSVNKLITVFFSIEVYFLPQ